MILFRHEILTTLYCEATAFILVLGLWIMTKKVRKKSDAGDRLQSALCVYTMLYAAFGAASYGVRYQHFAGAHIIAVLSKTAVETVVALLAYSWVIFVDYQLNRSRDHLKRRYRMAFIPVIVILAMLLINLFTGILYSFDEENVYHPTLIYPVIILIEFLYLVYSAALMVRYRKTDNAFIHVSTIPFLIPFVFMEIVSEMTPYSANPLGVAVGLVLFHFASMNRRCYEDDETGFYNIHYLRYLATVSGEGKYDFGSGLIFSATGHGKELAQILHDEMPFEAEVISLGKGRFLMLSRTVKRMAIQMLFAAVEEAAADRSFKVNTAYELRREKESIGEFAQRFLKEEDMHVAPMIGAEVIDAISKRN